MTPEAFAFYLKGFIELNKAGGLYGPPNERQWAMIKAHLDLVFNNITDEIILDRISKSPQIFPKPLGLRTFERNEPTSSEKNGCCGGSCHE